MVFIPTYLYIKQHTITGKLYFGKTTNTESGMLKYKGSGKHWGNHIKKHGKEYVVTLWYQLYDNVFDLVADALSMSKSFDIINNDSWLNLMLENGLTGGNVGISDHTRKLLSDSRMGEKNPFFSKTHNDNALRLISISSKNRKKSDKEIEEFRKRMTGELNHNYKKPVSEERKLKQSLSMRGRTPTEEHRKNQSIAQTKLYDILCEDLYILHKISMKEFSLLFGYNKESCRYSFKRYGKYKHFKLL